MIDEKFKGQNVPNGWFFNGRAYVDYDGKACVQHPSLEEFVTQYLAEQNGTIGDYNREVQKQWTNDIKQHE